ncbi:MAG: sensor histidine kinase [Acidimicrobiales bacterium]
MAVLERLAQTLRLTGIRSLMVHLGLIAAGIVFTVVGALILLADDPIAIEPASLPTAIGLVVPMLVILLGRCRWPLTVLVVSTGLLAVVRRLAVPELQVSSIAWIIALYSAGRYGRGRARDAVRALAIVAAAVLIVVDVVEVWGDLELFGFTERTFVLTAGANIGWNIVTFVGAWYAGDLARRRVQRERDLAARTLELEASREENARRAVMDERVRIAREIHDVVAHHVSVMGVQAGAARRALAADPSRAEAPLRDIEGSSREAVAELHRLLGFLRRVDEVDPDGLTPDALAPRPGLDRLPDLRHQLAGAGLALRLSISGQERPLPPSVDLNAFRIVQEALTNCLKYAAVDVAEVEIDFGPDRLLVAVRDRGVGPGVRPTPHSTGAGLLGMAERVALLGGTLRHGARDGGGFEVVAELPYAETAEAAPSTHAAAEAVPTPPGVAT